MMEKLLRKAVGDGNGGSFQGNVWSTVAWILVKYGLVGLFATALFIRFFWVDWQEIKALKEAEARHTVALSSIEQRMVSAADTMHTYVLQQDQKNQQFMQMMAMNQHLLELICYAVQRTEDGRRACLGQGPMAMTPTPVFREEDP